VLLVISIENCPLVASVTDAGGTWVIWPLAVIAAANVANPALSILNRSANVPAELVLNIK
jgi:hypothetical protein